MREQLQHFTESVGEFWNKFPPAYKVIIVAVVAAALITLIITGFLFNKPEYAVLYTDLTSSDLRDVVAKLAEVGIDVQVSRDKNEVRVPKKDLQKAYVELATAGLPKEEAKHPGFELFERTRLGVTDQQQRINLQAALQTELERTIRHFPGVKYVRVLITMPRRRLFLEEQEPTTASIMITTDGSDRFKPQYIQAIASFVARAVPGLKLSSETISITVDGIYLSHLIKDKSAGLDKLELTQDQRKIKKDYEMDLKGKIQSALAQAYGPEKVIVMVDVELDLTSHKIRRELYSPVVGEEGIPISKQERREFYTGKGTPGGQPGGVPGVTSNIPGYVETEAPQESEYELREQTINYEVNRVKEEIEKSPEVKKVSVSILIDRSIEGYKDSIKKIVSNLVSNSYPNSSESVVVEPASLLREPEMAAQAEVWWHEPLKMGVIALIVIAVLLFLRSILIEKVPPAAPEEVRPGVEVPIPGLIEAMQEEEERIRKLEEERLRKEEEERLRQEEEKRRKQEEEERKKREEEERKRKQLEEIINFAREHPDIVAEIIGRWITEEEKEE